MTFQRVVDTVQAAALAAALATVVMLFANEPAKVVPPVASAEGTVSIDGAQLYGSRCAGCHGSTGGGSVGPALGSGAAVNAFPEVDEMVRVVTEGRSGGMPGFGDRLSPEEIAAVVDYVRNDL